MRTKEVLPMVKLFRGRLRWVLVFLLFAMSAIAFLTRVNMSIAGQAVMNEYQWSNIQLGWVFSAFVIGYALSQAPVGRLVDRCGPRLVITIGILWWSVFTALTALVPVVASSLMIMIMVRALLGVGEAVIFPGANRLVANWIPSSEQGIANGFIFAGVGVGAAITPPLITFLMASYGWKWTFYIGALIGVVASVLWYALARDSPEHHPLIDVKELRKIQAETSGLRKENANAVLPWRIIVRDRQIILLSLSYFGYCYATYIFFTWFFIYLNKVRELDLKASSL